MTGKEKKMFQKHHAEMAGIFAEAAGKDCDMAKCMGKVAACHSAFCDAVGKAEGADDLQKMVSAVTEAVLANVNEKIGKLVVPSSVKGVFTTSDPSGGALIPRTGQPTPPTDLSRVPAEFAGLFQE